MTEQRFIIMDNLPKGTHSRIWDKQKQHNQGIGDELWLGEVVAMLNEGVMIAKENEQLKKELDKLKLVNEMLSMDFSNSEHELWRENKQLKQEIETLHEENQKLKKLNIPIDEIKDTVSDYRGRIIGVYYND